MHTRKLLTSATVLAVLLTLAGACGAPGPVGGIGTDLDNVADTDATLASDTVGGDPDTETTDAEAADSVVGVDVADPVDSTDGGGECGCGDGKCVSACGETLASCPADCSGCGDGICAPGEGPLSCAKDCCGGCGDGKCTGYACGESPTACPQDCKSACGNGLCDKGENPGICPEDCKKQVCGNGVCEPEDGGPTACPGDCGSACGNCLCDKGEDFQSCPVDCGYCGDGICSNCAALDEKSGTCAADCKGDGCPKGCDDGLTCTADLCGSDGTCQHEPNHGDCADNSACTDDTCDPFKGCVSLPNAATCDDGDLCTAADACKAGVCSGSLAACDDGNACTTDSCDKLANACAHTPTTAPCSDANPCTINDVCAKSSCSGVGKSCNDSDPCTDDLCKSSDGTCQHLAKAGCVTALKPCTYSSQCEKGVCDPAAHVCVPCLESSDCGAAFACLKNTCVASKSCTSSTDCKATKQLCWKDSSVCVDCMTDTDCGTGEACVEHTCGAAPPCNSDKDCLATCDKVKGVCVDCLESADCPGGKFCSGWQQCLPVLCSADACIIETKWDSQIPTSYKCNASGSGFGAAISCVDDDQCTEDTCVLGSGCQNTIHGGYCDDDLWCTTGDACVDGSCVGYLGTECDDNNPCTVDSCSQNSGCGHLPGTIADVPCDDGKPCTTLGVCVAGSSTCSPGIASLDGTYCGGAEKCQLGAVCLQGKCAAVAVPDGSPCMDDDPCTLETCLAGACSSVQSAPDGVACDDTNPCTVDACKAGICVSTPVPGGACSDGDGNFCTGGNCSAAGQCESSPTAEGAVCGDFTACTVGKCTDGTCTSSTAPDGTACGSDDNPCTSDVCSAGACYLPNTGMACDDKNDCTGQDTCVLSGKCAGQPLDGTGCHINYSNECLKPICVAGKCGAPLSDGSPCLDNEVCTLDECVGGECVGTPLDGAPCQDNNPCTLQVCAGGSCVATNDKNGLCSDGNPCTLDTCKDGGCIWTISDLLQCDDGEACTADACVAGNCVGMLDGNLPCSDGNPCTNDDSCASGACSGVVEDGGLCGTDTTACSSHQCLGGGCVAIPTAATMCDDGNPCTTDKCAGGKCIGVAADLAACSDGNPCTADKCISGKCASTPDPSATCTDSYPCYTVSCVEGYCKATGPSVEGKPCDVNPCATEHCSKGYCLADKNAANPIIAKPFGAGFNDAAPRLTGGYVAVGAAGAGKSRGLIATFDATGKLLASSDPSEGPADLEFETVHSRPNGDFVVTGMRGSEFEDGFSIVRAVSAGLDTQWEYQATGLGSFGSVEAAAIAPNGDVLAFGARTSKISIFTGTPSFVGWVGRLNASGQLIWQKDYEALPGFRKAEMSGSSAVAVSGSGADTAVTKIDSAGSVVWQTKILAPTNQYGPSGIELAPSGTGWMIAGSKGGGIWVALVSQNGSLEWLKTFEDPTYPDTMSLTSLPDGTVAIVAGSGTPFLLHIDTDGHLLSSGPLGGLVSGSGSIKAIETLGASMIGFGYSYSFADLENGSDQYHAAAWYSVFNSDGGPVCPP